MLRAIHHAPIFLPEGGNPRVKVLGENRKRKSVTFTFAGQSGALYTHPGTGEFDPAVPTWPGPAIMVPQDLPLTFYAEGCPHGEFYAIGGQPAIPCILYIREVNSDDAGEIG